MTPISSVSCERPKKKRFFRSVYSVSDIMLDVLHTKLYLFFTLNRKILRYILSLALKIWRYWANIQNQIVNSKTYPGEKLIFTTKFSFLHSI